MEVMSQLVLRIATTKGLVESVSIVYFDVDEVRVMAAALRVQTPITDQITAVNFILVISSCGSRRHRLGASLELVECTSLKECWLLYLVTFHIAKSTP
jgi:hypothetical protein